MGGDTCKQYILKRVNTTYKENPYNSTSKETNNLIKKWVEYLNQPLFEEDIDVQQVHEKVFNITNHQGNAN